MKDERSGESQGISKHLMSWREFYRSDWDRSRVHLLRRVNDSICLYLRFGCIFEDWRNKPVTPTQNLRSLGVRLSLPSRLPKVWATKDSIVSEEKHIHILSKGKLAIWIRELWGGSSSRPVEEEKANWLEWMDCMRTFRYIDRCCRSLFFQPEYHSVYPHARMHGSTI